MTESVITLSEPIKSFDMDGFLLTERIHPTNCVLPLHTHEETILGFALKGSFLELDGRRGYECEPLHLQILPGGEPHSYRFGHAAVRCVTIEVRPQTLARIRLFSDVLDRTTRLTGMRLAAHLRQLYREFCIGDRVSALTIEGLLFETLGAATRETRCRQTVHPRWLLQAREQIHSQFPDKVSLADLASSVGVHPALEAILTYRQSR